MIDQNRDEKERQEALRRKREQLRLDRTQRGIRPISARVPDFIADSFYDLAERLRNRHQEGDREAILRAVGIMDRLGHPSWQRDRIVPPMLTVTDLTGRAVGRIVARIGLETKCGRITRITRHGIETREEGVEPKVHRLREGDLPGVYKTRRMKGIVPLDDS